MPRPRNPVSRPYGRQAKNKTIKSVSFDDDLASFTQELADEFKISFSEAVNRVMAGGMPKPDFGKKRGADARAAQLKVWKDLIARQIASEKSD